MIELPKPIASWTKLLSSFPSDVSELVMPLVNQLSNLIESVPTAEDKGEIEPDGLDGVGSVVQYDRLLLSEWSLQEQFPEEFIRRAVSGEHLFYKLKTVEQKEDKTCFALFDCGPEQLGKPRLVQLAILILLARRAEKNKLKFKWGVFQDPKKQLNEGLEKESVIAWLQQRSVMLADQASLDSWSDVFIDDYRKHASTDENVSAEDLLKDFWIICKSELMGPVQQTRKVKIEESLLEPNSIDVSVRSSSSLRRASLLLAKEELNVRVIRNPFSSPAKMQLSSDWKADGTWLISSNGRRIACRSDHGNIVLHSLNISSPKSIGDSSVFNVPEGQECIGLHLTKKRVFAVCSGQRSFFFHNYPKNGMVKEIVKTQSIREAENDKLFLNTVINHCEGGKVTVLILDFQSNLRELELNDRQTLFKTKSTDVLMLGSLVNCDYYIKHDREDSKLTMYWYLGAHMPSSKTFKLIRENTTPTIFLHGAGPWHKGSIGCLAYETDVNTWELVSGHKQQKLTTDECDKVVGVISLSGKLPLENNYNQQKKSALVILKPDLKSIYAVFNQEEVLLQVLSSEFVKGEVNPRHPYLHYVNSLQEMIVIDLINGHELLRLANGSVG